MDIFSNNWLILFFLLLVLILIRLAASFLIKRQKFPYEIKLNYLTAAELRFLSVLNLVVNNRYEIIPQVPLKSIVKVKNNVSNFYTYHNQIDRKVLDFVLFTKVSYKPLLIIELDDASHNYSDRKTRDNFVNIVANIVKIPILHVPAKYSYSSQDLLSKIDELIVG